MVVRESLNSGRLEKAWKKGGNKPERAREQPRNNPASRPMEAITDK
jgi:hypothetical protein